MSCKGKSSAWAHGGKQAELKALEGTIASPHMRSGLALVADGMPKLTSPVAIGLDARKKKTQWILLDLLLDIVKYNSSIIRFFHKPSPSPTNRQLVV